MPNVKDQASRESDTTTKDEDKCYNLKKIAASVLSFLGTKSVWKSHKRHTAQIDKRNNRRRQETHGHSGKHLHAERCRSGSN
jgi:hypothetical protein